MSTPNFTTQDYFDMYVTCYEELSEEQQQEYNEEWGCSYDAEVDSMLFYEDLISNFKYALIGAEKKFNRELEFFNITLKDGYYSGVQTFVEPADTYKGYYDTVEDMDNEDTKYYFGMCRSKAIRKYNSEKKFIDKKLLPYIAENTGMRKLNCIGIFSNGEAVYEWAD